MIMILISSMLFVVITTTNIELGRTTLELNDKYGDILFGKQTGLFLARDVQTNLGFIRDSYRKEFNIDR